MRLTSIVTFALFSLALAADKGPGTRFRKFFGKQQSATPVKLDDASYEDLTSTPRDFAAVVLLTALPAQFGCEACRVFQTEYQVLAQSWLRGDKQGDSRVLFGYLDFSDGKTTFQKLMLQTAPVLILFPPTTGPNAKPDAQPIRLDFTGGVQTAESVHAWISRQLPDIPKPALHRPFNYVRAMTITTMLLGTVTVVGIAGPYVLPLLQNRNVWAAISLIMVLMFTSGHMFNHIRKTPYVSGDGRGGMQYFAGGFGNQFGMETQIVAAMYGILAFSAIALGLKVPRIADAKQQTLSIVIWGVVMFGMYGFLLSVFKVKNGGYPFRLPPF